MGRLVTLNSGNIELGVLPDLGGVVALFRLSDKPNVLKADHAIWNAPPRIRRSFGPETRWKAHNGHIIWVGPQSEWWIHQEKSPRRQQKKAVWPPDPYLNFGYFEPTEKSDTHITMVGPPSEFTGLQMTKTIVIREDDTVSFHVRATNIRSRPVAWDLWFNTRVDGYARCYVPLSDTDLVRVDHRNTRSQEAGSFQHEAGFLNTDPLPPSNGKKHRWAKAFIPADYGLMTAFASSQAFTIRFSRHEAEQIHPEHSLVELYNCTSHNRADALTELEYHTPYRTLLPGESMEASEEWILQPFSRCDDHRSCISYMKELVSDELLKKQEIGSAVYS
ncbi:MAG: DUF4380 domain-containing protein [Chitinispirillaceae bacterium]